MSCAACSSRVEKAVSKGIINGYGDGTLRPENAITRIEALVLSSRCLPELESISDPVYFKDVPDWAKSDIARLSSAGLLEDTEDGFLGAFDKMTVSEVKELIDWLPTD